MTKGELMCARKNFVAYLFVFFVVALQIAGAASSDDSFGTTLSRQSSVSLVSHWNFISAPFSDAAIDASSCGADANAVASAIPAIYHYNPATRGYDSLAALSSMKPGLGYWAYLDAKKPCEIKFTGSKVVTLANLGEKLDGKLKTGWNQISGTTIATKLSDATNKEECEIGVVYGYDAKTGSYVSVEGIEAGKAYWVYAEKECTLWSKLRYDENRQAYVLPELDKTIIRGLDLSTNSGRINVFFDGKPHPNSEFRYVSMNIASKELILSSVHQDLYDNPKFSVIFTNNNPFVRIEDNDFFSVDYLDRGQIYIQNRDDQNLIPKLIVKEYFKQEGGYPVTAIITNARFNYAFKKGSFTDWSMLPEEVEKSVGKTSTPLSILYLDSTGNNYLKDKSGQKLIFSNFNEVAMLPEGAAEGLTVTSESYNYAPSKVSETLSFNYPLNYRHKLLDKLASDYPSLKLAGFIDTVAIKRILNTLNSIPIKLSEDMRNVYFDSDEQFSKAGHFKTVAYAEKNGDIHVKVNSPKASTIYHESIHLYFYNYDAETKAIRELKQKIDDVWKKINELIVSDPNDNRLGPLYAQVNQLYDELNQAEHPLKKDWLLVVGGKEAYDNLVEEINGEAIWADAPAAVKEGFRKGNLEDINAAQKPKNGFVRAYAATNIEEDIAETADKAYENPAFFKPYITPGSAEYDVRYRQKLDLLYRYGFMTEELYTRVVE